LLGSLASFLPSLAGIPLLSRLLGKKVAGKIASSAAKSLLRSKAPRSFASKIVKRALLQPRKLFRKAIREPKRAVRAALNASKQRILKYVPKLGKVGSVSSKIFSGKSLATSVGPKLFAGTAKKGALSVASKAVKRIPIVGGAITAGLTYASTKSATQAVGAGVGSAAGTAIGGVIGQTLIPIPVLGAAIGAIAGDYIGSIIGQKMGKAFEDRHRASKADKTINEATNPTSKHGTGIQTIASIDQGPAARVAEAQDSDVGIFGFMTGFKNFLKDEFASVLASKIGDQMATKSDNPGAIKDSMASALRG
jgi:hypothetical protein